MKSHIRLFSLAIFFFYGFLINPFGMAAQTGEEVVYIWEFTTREGERNAITKSFTEEFKEALIQSQCCTILQRRCYARLLDQKRNEKSITSFQGLSESTLVDLKSLEAEMVVFGEVYDDSSSGQVKFSAQFETFTGNIYKKASSYLPKYALADPSKRETAVEELISELDLIPKLRKPKMTKTLGNWELSLTECQSNGSTVTCGFLVKSLYRDRGFTLYGNANPGYIAYDEFNNK